MSSLKTLLTRRLEAENFRPKGKGYFRAGDEVSFELVLDPEYRLARVENLLVFSSLTEPGDRPAYEFFTFDQCHAATGDWRASYLDIPVDLREERIVEDLDRVTIPFIQRATSLMAVADLLSSGEVPPMNGGHGSADIVRQLYRIGEDFRVPALRDRAVRLAQSTQFDAAEHASLMEWARRTGLELALRPAAHRKRRWRWRRSV